MRELLQELRLDTLLAKKGNACFAEEEATEEEVRLEEPIFMDDLACLITGATAMEAICMSVKVVDGFAKIYRRYGFSLNMVAGRLNVLPQCGAKKRKKRNNGLTTW